MSCFFNSRYTRPIVASASILMISAVAACSDDERGNVPASRVTGPTSAPAVSFGKNDKPTTTRRIAFISPQKKLRTMRPDGTDIIELAGSNAVEDDLPAWSPDYTKIAFVSNRAGGLSALHIVNADMTGLQTLTTGMFIKYPTFSADGKKILFQTANLSGNYDIVAKDLETGNLTQLTTDPAYDVMPHVSPDGSKILFTSQRDGHSEIYVMNADGSNQTRVSYCGVDCFNAKWSPDGSRIAFVSDVFGGTVFVTAPGDMLRYQAVTPARVAPTGFVNMPSWSPDGKKLVFYGYVNSTNGMYTVNVDGTGLVNLMPGVSTKSPAWAW